MTSSRLKIDGTRFRDGLGREVIFRGINCAGDAKFPRCPDQPSHVPQRFFDGDNVSFVDRPFSKEEAHIHLTRLKRWGYNTIRYVFTWEAIEHAGPGQYDEDFITHTIEILRLMKAYGFYVYMDPHQDVWSRFSGGSGAPLWTLYACGLNPEAFHTTQAALVHSQQSDPADYPKMIWASNYSRLACQTLFTLFFGGKDFAPNAIIDGKNIQDYLTDHFIAACRRLAQRIHEAGDLEDRVVVGWESMNEPNRGLISWQDISVIPSDQKLRKGTTPTAWQAILTGAGRACEVDTYEFGSFGPYQNGRLLVDPKGLMAWLPADYDDTKYGWKRDSGWKLGECLWAQQGVWDPADDRLLQKDYFAKVPLTGKKLDYEEFNNTYFMDHYRKYRDAIRSVHKDAIMFCQAPVLEIPPNIKGSEDDDPLMVFASHYYDGLTLLTKHWNRLYNVDVFGVLRGRYLSPVFAVKIGTTAIRNCLRDQLEAIRQEGLEHLGTHPCIFTEIGIPYDMDDKYAYRTGDYSSQRLAMDANHYALEGSGAVGYALWVYVAENNHEWGDLWNGEDLSIYSVDGVPLLTPSLESIGDRASTKSIDKSSAAYSYSQLDSNVPVTPSNVKSALKPPSFSSERGETYGPQPINSGFRAGEAFVRPSPIYTSGDVLQYGFDLSSCTFTLSLSAGLPAAETSPTEVFLPEYHFRQDSIGVEVSDGKWIVDLDQVKGGPIQILRWWHPAGDQKITIKGTIQQQSATVGSDDEAGYLEQYRRSLCSIM